MSSETPLFTFDDERFKPKGDDPWKGVRNVDDYDVRERQEQVRRAAGFTDQPVATSEPKVESPEEGVDRHSDAFNDVVSHIDVGIKKSRAGGYAELKVESDDGTMKLLGEYLTFDLFRASLTTEERLEIIEKYHRILVDFEDDKGKDAASQPEPTAKSSDSVNEPHSRPDPKPYESVDWAKRAAGDYERE